jgi:hypothetical protein
LGAHILTDDGSFFNGIFAPALLSVAAGIQTEENGGSKASRFVFF